MKAEKQKKRRKSQQSEDWNDDGTMPWRPASRTIPFGH